MADPDDIDRLAAAGRARRQARDAAEVDAAAAGDARAQRRARISTTRLGFFTTYTGGLIIALGSLGGWGLVFYPSLFRRSADDAVGVLLLFAPFVLAVLGVLGARVAIDAWSRVAHRRTLAWAQGLPFTLSGLDAMLAGDPPVVGVVSVRLAGDGDLDRIAAAVTGLGRRWVDADVAGGAVVIRHGCLGMRDDAGPQAPDTNHPYLRFVRWLIDDFLSAVHRRDPIAKVAIGER